MTEEEKQEEKQERKTLRVGELLHLANAIENNLSEEHHLSSAEIMFIGTILQGSATTEYMIHNLFKRAHVQVIKIPPEQRTELRQEFKLGEN